MKVLRDECQRRNKNEKNLDLNKMGSGSENGCSVRLTKRICEGASHTLNQPYLAWDNPSQNEKKMH